jgi:hypothetical protein
MSGTKGTLHPATNAQVIKRYKDRNSTKKPHIFCNYAQHQLRGLQVPVCIHRFRKTHRLALHWETQQQFARSEHFNLTLRDNHVSKTLHCIYQMP